MKKNPQNSHSRAVGQQKAIDGTEQPALSTPSSIDFDKTPDTPLEMINAYGTYEIQPTLDTDNKFPAIGQGNPEWAQRDLRFYRNAHDQRTCDGKGDAQDKDCEK